MTNQPTMEIKELPLKELKPAAYNPRKKLKKGDKEYEKIKQSLLKFGYVDPIIVNEDLTVIGGHQRLTVLKDLDYETAKCVIVKLSKEDEKALNIALNKITGQWDEALLADLLLDLQESDFSLDLTGFEPPEIDDILSNVHDKELSEDEFDVEEELKKPTVSRRGDIWQLGKHRVICGDSTKSETYDQLLGVGRSPYQWQHEPCLYGWKKKGKHQWFSDRKQTTIWEYDRPKSSRDHPTMKPIQLMAYPIQNSSMRGTIVLDPFLGSGSTLIAADQTGRVCYGIELDEKFVDVIVKRYIEVTGDTEVTVQRNHEVLTYNQVLKELEEQV